MKVIIIGAGIAGMSAGIYALQSGFDVTIYESHSIAGGNSTSWKRGDYFFEGGLHWLVGSSEKTSLNKLWHEVGALQENNPIHNRDTFITYINGKEKIELHRNIDNLEASLLAISPEDEKAIKQLGKDIRVMMKASSMPVTDIKGVKVKTKSKMSLSTILAYIAAGKTMARLSKMTVGEYIAPFQHEGIRTLLLSVVAAEDYAAMASLFTLGGFAAGDSGYPKGGSLRMAKNIADTFVRSGGVLELSKKVERVNVEHGKANGVWIEGMLQKADAVIVTADTLTAIDYLFVKPLHEPWMDELRRDIVPVNCTFVSLGVAADLSHLPANVIMPLKEPFKNGGQTYPKLAFNNYAKFDGYAPKGCTAVTTIMMEDTYDEWKKAKEDGSYAGKKQELAELVISRFEQIVPEAKGKVEVWDVATPVTYERYCSTYRGSWMSIMRTDNKRMNFPCKSESIDRLYFAGQRIMLPGGVPSALMTGRKAVQHLCKDTDAVFQGKM